MSSPSTLRHVRISVVVLAVAGLLVALLFLRDGDDASSTAPPASPERSTAPASDGPPVPDLEFELFDGTTATFADFRGKPLVVNFWASWCPACVVELPEFQEVHAQLGEEVTFLGVANADDRARAVELAEQAGLTYALADDPAGELFVEFGLFAMPSTVFVTADGIVHDTFGGQLDAGSLTERIESLLATDLADGV